MDMGFLGDWGLIDRVAESEGTYAEPPSKKKASGLQSLYVNTKSRLYNLVRPISNTLPEFSNSPIFLLGKVYRLEEAERLELEKSVSTQQDRPVWAMGFNIAKTKPEMQPHVKKFLKDFGSKIWLTYRSQFPAIEPTTYTTDMGWGCMLRTGQMLLAQAFIFHYLGRDWRVQSNKHMPLYYQVLRWFADVPSAPYSIHMIANTASARFSKKVGEWFEPTTISYTLSELVALHHPEGLKMYVAKDGMIYRNEIEQMCTFVRQQSRAVASLNASPQTTPPSSPVPSHSPSSPPTFAAFPSPAVPHLVTEHPLLVVSSSSSSSSHEQEEDDEITSVPSPLLTTELPTSSPSTSPLVPLRDSGDEEILCTSPSADKRRSQERCADLLRTSSFEDICIPREQEEGEKETEAEQVADWYPVIILIPARLGIDTLNPIYIHAIKEFLSFPQSLGIVGGKPHSSFYFVGYQDNTLFYLDPHIIAPAVNMDEDFFPTNTFHTSIPQSMPITEIDPSLALGFYCKDRAEFDDFLLRLNLVAEEGETVVSVVDAAPDYVLKARRKSQLAKELMDDEEIIFV